MRADLVASRLRRLRTESRKSQQCVADFCGISQVALSRYERGERLPDVGALLALADFYRVSLDALVGRQMAG